MCLHYSKSSNFELQEEHVLLKSIYEAIGNNDNDQVKSLTSKLIDYHNTNGNVDKANILMESLNNFN